MNTFGFVTLLLLGLALVVIWIGFSGGFDRAPEIPVAVATPEPAIDLAEVVEAAVASALATHTAPPEPEAEAIQPAVILPSTGRLAATPGSRSAATQEPTATPRNTPKPPPTSTPASKAAPAPRQTLDPVNIPGRRAETIFTSTGQQVDVVVSGFADSPAVFDLLVEIIDVEETLLGLPFPAPSVSVRRVSSVDGGFCGYNIPDYRFRYVGEPYRMIGADIALIVDSHCDDLTGSLAHEVAHTWFHGNTTINWVDEGLANAVERQVVEILVEDEVHYPPITHCESYANLAELEAANPAEVTSGRPTGFSCNYTLGDGIFGSLRDYYGDNQFNRLIARLARSQVSRTREEFTIEDIRRVLGDDLIALPIINYWYEGQPETRKYLHLDAVEWTTLPTIDGNLLHFAGIASEPGLLEEFALGSDDFCSQFSLQVGYDGTGRSVGIADPLPVRWRHQTLPDVKVISHRNDPATGEFWVTAIINEATLLAQQDTSLLMESRVKAGADGLCRDGVSYSQADVVLGTIPPEFREPRHYHLDAIEWTTPPSIVGNTLEFEGRSSMGDMRIEHRPGYCGQFTLYTMDDWGYHYLGNISPLFTGGRAWVNPLARITSGYEGSGGHFKAVVSLRDSALAGYDSVVLVVSTEPELDRRTNNCGDSDVLSAVDVR